MDLQQLVHYHSGKLSELDENIIQYILENIDEVQGLSIMSLAEKVHVSKSSVLRLSKKLGFTGFSELKYYLKQETVSRHNLIEEQDLFSKQLDDIGQTLNYLRSIDMKPINELLEASTTIYCYATGFSQKKPLEEFSKMMLSLHKRVIILPNKTELDMAMPMISPADCFIVSSVSGETENIKENLTTLKLRKIKTIALTLPGNNYFARHTTYHLNYYCTPFSVNGNHSSLSLLSLHCLIDYLYRSYISYNHMEG